MYFSLPTSQEREQKLLEKNNNNNNINNNHTLPSINTTSQSHSSSNTSLSSETIYNKYSNSSITDERFVEIVENLEDHWRSPPILTPTTLALIFNNNWVETNTTSPVTNNNNNNSALNRANSVSDKDIVSLASLQCFLSQFQKTVAQHIPSLEKVLKEDDMLCNLRNGDTRIPAHNAIDHLTQLLAMYNNNNPPSSSSSNGR